VVGLDIGGQSLVDRGRIGFIDGLRGVAILGVLVFHAYVSAPDNLPFGNRYGGILPLRLGWVGVELFFLISGFVILMTLQNCKGPADFFFRRWLRLFPAMLIASALILCFDYFVNLGPFSDRTLADAIPGLLFVSPALIHAVTRLSLQSLDTPFWSLYVEVIFYVVSGFLFFVSGFRSAIASVFLLSMISYLLSLTASLGYVGVTIGKIAEAMDWLGFTQFSWFASGALFFRYFMTKRSSVLYLAVIVGIIAALVDGLFRFDFTDRMGLLCTVLLFACCIRFDKLQYIVANRIFQFFGFISYPFYLIHDNMLIALEFEVSKYLPPGAVILAPIAPAVLLIFVAWVIAKYLEPAARRSIRRGMSFGDRSAPVGAQLPTTTLR
jgi:peptidoglycan/LPS O-acetylase OafA/YrhL